MLSLNVATELHREVGSGFLISEAPPNPKGWPALIGPKLSAYVGDALLGICFGRVLWLRRQLKHRRLLTFT